jgi:hypothetical protein
MTERSTEGSDSPRVLVHQHLVERPEAIGEHAVGEPSPPFRDRWRVAAGPETDTVRLPPPLPPGVPRHPLRHDDQLRRAGPPAGPGWRLAGGLTGFGGGLDRKRWLLDHEAAVLAARGDRPLPAVPCEVGCPRNSGEGSRLDPHSSPAVL